ACGTAGRCSRPGCDQSPRRQPHPACGRHGRYRSRHPRHAGGALRRTPAPAGIQPGTAGPAIGRRHTHQQWRNFLLPAEQNLFIRRGADPVKKKYIAMVALAGWIGVTAWLASMVIVKPAVLFLGNNLDESTEA